MDDRQRFNDVVLPHVDTGLSLARWLTGNVANAEDVVQEACLRAFRAIATVRKKPFDMHFTRRLFLKTYWTGVEGGEWEPDLPGNQKD